MDINEIKELVRLIDESTIEELEVERSGVRVRIRRSRAEVRMVEAAAPRPVEVQAPATKAEAEVDQDDGLHVFTSPMVGTFYSSPKPDADTFVTVGEKVGQGTVLCIIEAMKLFNEIECDVDGVIESVLVENAQPVEFGEALFKIRV